MNMVQVIQLVKDFFRKNLEKEAHVIGVSWIDGLWLAEVESVEDSDYLRRRGQDDILAVYEVSINPEGQIMKYQRKALRSRADLEFQAQD